MTITQHTGKKKSNEMEWKQFTHEDHQLFLKVAQHIKSHPDKYRAGGEHMDEFYYDEDSYWMRVQCSAEL